MEQNNKKEVKPIEFVIYKTDGSKFYIKFWYSDGTSDEKEIEGVPNLIPINKHYALTDTYGYHLITEEINEQKR